MRVSVAPVAGAAAVLLVCPAVQLRSPVAIVGKEGSLPARASRPLAVSERGAGRTQAAMTAAPAAGAGGGSRAAGTWESPARPARRGAAAVRRRVPVLTAPPPYARASSGAGPPTRCCVAPLQHASPRGGRAAHRRSAGGARGLGAERWAGPRLAARGAGG